MAVIEAWTLPKERLEEFFERLKRWGKIVAPKTGPEGAPIVGEVERLEEVRWDNVSPINSPKSFLYPQVDPIFRYRLVEGRYEIEQVGAEEEPTVFFAIHSCDVRGIEFLTKIFTVELPDEHFLRRRRNSLIVSVTCQDPAETCFCICSNSGPFLKEGFDVQLTDLGEKFLVEIGSEKGLDVAGECKDILERATDADVEERNRREEAARDNFKPWATSFFAAAMARLTLRRVEERALRQVADFCIECGGCTTVCPTCYCFNVVDVGTREEGERVFVWDACKYEGYTREASGFNPRPFLWRRVWNRYFCKVSHERYTAYGMVGCVGCGRCIMVCPAMADMPFAIKAIRRGEAKREPTVPEEVLREQSPERGQGRWR